VRLARDLWREAPEAERHSAGLQAGVRVRVRARVRVRVSLT